MAGIVSTEWLSDHINDPQLRIIDARGSFATYEEGHIPGAQMLHIETLRMSKNGVPCLIFSPEVISIIFGRLGISENSTVVTYATNPQDVISATFTTWNLNVHGNKSAYVLDGGLAKWEAEGLMITKPFPKIEDAVFHTTLDRSIYADWQYIFEHIEDSQTVLVDTRTLAMYTGEEGPTQRRGHIPGAIHHDFIWDFRSDGCYAPLEKVRRKYEEDGITPDKNIVTYCVTGREGSAAWFMLKEILGYPNVKLYQGSMTEWTAHPELPLVVGDRPYGGQMAA